MTRYEELIEQIRVNLNDDKRFKQKLIFIKDRIKHYSEKLGYPEVEILEAFEEKRNYWSANYYQESNFPLLEENVKIFKDEEELIEAIKSKQFICPACEQIKSNPYTCNSGYKDKKGKVCDWKSYGLLNTLGKGFRFTIRDTFLGKPIIDECFMPIDFKNTIYDPEYLINKITRSETSNLENKTI